MAFSAIRIFTDAAPLPYPHFIHGHTYHLDQHALFFHPTRPFTITYPLTCLPSPPHPPHHTHLPSYRSSSSTATTVPHILSLCFFDLSHNPQLQRTVRLDRSNLNYPYCFLGLRWQYSSPCGFSDAKPTTYHPLTRQPRRRRRRRRRRHACSGAALPAPLCFAWRWSSRCLHAFTPQRR